TGGASAGGGARGGPRPEPRSAPTRTGCAPRLAALSATHAVSWGSRVRASLSAVGWACALARKPAQRARDFSKRGPVGHSFSVGNFPPAPHTGPACSPSAHVSRQPSLRVQFELRDCRYASTLFFGRAVIVSGAPPPL